MSKGEQEGGGGVFLGYLCGEVMPTFLRICFGADRRRRDT